MENASKAVIMAGGVLIAVAVISLALYAYANFKGYVTTSEEMLTAEQIQSFNRFYESFPDTIRGVDVINIINKAKDDGLAEDNPSDLPAIPPELTGADQSKHYLDSYNYDIDYDLQGKVTSISFSI